MLTLHSDSQPQHTISVVYSVSCPWGGVGWGVKSTKDLPSGDVSSFSVFVCFSFVGN